MNEFDPGRNPVIDRNYLTSENVRARFHLYEFAKNPMDFDMLVLNTAVRNIDDDVVDLGAADGNLLVLLETVYGHQGLRLGVEPNISQVEKNTPRFDLGRLERSISRTLGKLISPDIKNILAAEMAGSVDVRLNLIEGTASNIPIGDNTADVMLAMFMLYHVPEEQLTKAFGEIKRVLRPDGVFALATSGAENKRVHRQHESNIAEYLNINAPTAMNRGFNTERAQKELAKYFKHVYMYRQDDEMIIDDDYKLEAYLNSLRSLRDQFEPIPTKEQFDAALEAVVLSKIYDDVEVEGRFTDIIQRSLFISSDSPFDIPSNFLQLAPNAQKA